MKEDLLPDSVMRIKAALEEFKEVNKNFKRLSDHNKEILNNYWRWQFEYGQLSLNDPKKKFGERHDYTVLDMKEQILDGYRKRQEVASQEFIRVFDKISQKEFEMRDYSLIEGLNSSSVVADEEINEVLA